MTRAERQEPPRPGPLRRSTSRGIPARGRIISVSGLAALSTGSVIGSIRNVAVPAMTKNLDDELGPSGVSVNAVHPGLTRTEATPRGRPAGRPPLWSRRWPTRTGAGTRS